MLKGRDEKNLTASGPLENAAIDAPSVGGVAMASPAGGRLSEGGSTSPYTLGQLKSDVDAIIAAKRGAAQYPICDTTGKLTAKVTLGECNRSEQLGGLAIPVIRMGMYVTIGPASLEPRPAIDTAAHVQDTAAHVQDTAVHVQEPSFPRQVLDILRARRCTLDSGKSLIADYSSRLWSTDFYYVRCNHLGHYEWHTIDTLGAKAPNAMKILRENSKLFWETFSHCKVPNVSILTTAGNAPFPPLVQELSSSGQASTDTQAREPSSAYAQASADEQAKLLSRLNTLPPLAAFTYIRHNHYVSCTESSLYFFDWTKLCGGLSNLYGDIIRQQCPYGAWHSIESLTRIVDPSWTDYLRSKRFSDHFDTPSSKVYRALVSPSWVISTSVISTRDSRDNTGTSHNNTGTSYDDKDFVHVLHKVFEHATKRDMAFWTNMVAPEPKKTVEQSLMPTHEQLCGKTLAQGKALIEDAVKSGAKSAGQQYYCIENTNQWYSQPQIIQRFGSSTLNRFLRYGNISMYRLYIAHLKNGTIESPILVTPAEKSTVVEKSVEPPVMPTIAQLHRKSFEQGKTMIENAVLLGALKGQVSRAYYYLDDSRYGWFTKEQVIGWYGAYILTKFDRVTNLIYRAHVNSIVPMITRLQGKTFQQGKEILETAAENGTLEDAGYYYVYDSVQFLVSRWYTRSEIINAFGEDAPKHFTDVSTTKNAGVCLYGRFYDLIEAAQQKAKQQEAAKQESKQQEADKQKSKQQQEAKQQQGDSLQHALEQDSTAVLDFSQLYPKSTGYSHGQYAHCQDARCQATRTWLGAENSTEKPEKSATAEKFAMAEKSMSAKSKHQKEKKHRKDKAAQLEKKHRKKEEKQLRRELGELFGVSLPK